MLNDKKICSVIIPTYNRSELLNKTLETLFGCQTDRTLFEVIVVDDGSSDDSFKVAKLFERKGNFKFVYQPDKGFRAARARNLGIALAEGEICIFIDSGILVHKALIDAHRAAHQRAARTVVMGKILGIYSENPKGLDWINNSNANGFDNELMKHVANKSLVDPRQVCFDACDGDLNRLPMPWGIAWTANISAKRQDLVDVGGFDENYTSWGCEDLDLALTLSKSGCKFGLAPDALALHAPHDVADENQRTNDSMMRYMHSKFQMPETETMITTSRIELNLKGIKKIC